MVLIRQNKGAKIILHAKSPTFRAAKLKGFTVVLIDKWFLSEVVGTVSWLSVLLAAVLHLRLSLSSPVALHLEVWHSMVPLLEVRNRLQALVLLVATPVSPYISP